MNAKTTTFMWKNPKTPDAPPTEMSIFDYFQKMYGMTIAHWQLPLVVTERAGMFPMEVCQIQPNQRYMYKMSPEQVSSLFKSS